MSDDYTPTMAELKDYATSYSAIASEAEWDRALVAHDAAKRAEWEAEQGAEVEYRVFDREGELWASTNSLDEARHYLAQESSGFARIERAVWLPVPDTGAES